MSRLNARCLPIIHAYCSTLYKTNITAIGPMIDVFEFYLVTYCLLVAFYCVGCLFVICILSLIFNDIHIY